MKKTLKHLLLLLLIIGQQFAQAQNQTAKWYFGATAGLDFMGPPTILTNGMMNPWEGCASIADGAGALLFYTDGITVWNKTHAVMANGTGLNGNGSTTQSGVIVKQPGNTNIYFIFTEDAQAAPNGLKYSIVDMNLAAGNGSVTAKNIPLFTPSDEKITAVRHCNGVDVWVVTHDWNSNNFRCFLVTTAGVGAPVNSAVGTIHNGSNANTIGQMKASPNGRKLGLAIHDTPFNSFELYDFNNSTGVVSNPLILGNTFNWAYGCEFSPDGTKFYGGKYGGGTYNLYQWDICAGTPAAIIASKFTVATMPAMPMSLQLAMNGKIYVCRFSQQVDGVINSPNTLGAGCAYVDLGQSTAPKTNNLGLPNFITSFFKTPPPPFTYTINSSVSCLTASFNAPPTPTVPCSSSGYSVTGLVWNFGDPGSGPLNTSTLTNPSHTYPGPGTYTSSLIMNYTCGADTIKIPVIIVSPSLAITSTSATCSSLGSATVVASGGSGPYSYTWTPTAQTTSVATNLTSQIYTVTVKDLGGGCIVTGTVNLGSQSLMSSTVTGSSVTCNGASTGSATLAISGGSGNYSYTWTPSAQSTSIATNLSAQIYTITANDLNNSCTTTKTIQILQPNALTLTPVANTPTACTGNSITLSALTTGGTGPAYTYTWLPSTVSSSMIATQATGGNYTYSVTSKDANNCSVSNTISVSFVNNPTVTTISSTICIGQTATISASGATNYLWNPSALTGSSISVSPAATTVYTVTGSNGACSSTATATVLVNALPTPTALSNSPVCLNQPINFTGSGASTYTWTGPNSFSSTAQNPSIPTASLVNAGNYTLTVTNANGCINNTVTNVVVNPLPVIVVNNPVACLNTNFTLTATGGTAYAWNGPNSYASNLQNPPFSSASTTLNGNYTVMVTSAQGCTQTAVAIVSVVPLPTVSVVGTNTLCSQNFNGSPNTVILTSSGASTFTWTLPAGYSASPNLNSNTITLTPIVTAVQSIATLSVMGSSGSCSSSAVYSVTVMPNPTIAVTSGSMCFGTNVSLSASGAASYTWSPAASLNTANGSTVIASPAITTVYSVIGSSVGCNSQTQNGTASVVANPAPFITPNTPTICIGGSINLTANGATSYSWFPNTAITTTVGANVTVNPTVSTTYTIIGSQATCTNTAFKTVTVVSLPVINITTASPTLCMNNYNGSANTVAISATGATSYTWTGFSGLNPSALNGANIVGTSILQSPIGSGSVIGMAATCTNIASFSVAAIPNPVISVTSASMCFGTNAILTANGASNYFWSPAATLNSSTGSSVIASPAVTSIYSVYGSSLNCNSTSQTATVDVVANPTIAITSVGVATICAGTSIGLNGSGATSYTWSPSSSLNNSNNASVIASPMVTTNYILVGSLNSCTASAIKQVTVIPMPTLQAVSERTAMCSGDKTSINANGALSYTWTPSAGISNPFSNFIIASPNVSTTYSLIGNNGMCTATLVVPITVIQKPVLILSTSNQKICFGNNSTIFASGSNSYSWAPNVNMNHISNNAVVVTPTVSTNYTISAVNAAGTVSCLMTQEILIDVVPQVTASVSNSVTICEGASAQLNAGGSNTYNWAPATGLNNAHIASPYANPSISTIYTVYVSNDGFCGSTGTVLVKVSPKPEVYAGPDFTINLDEPMYLNASGTGTMTWIFGEGILCHACPNSQITPKNSGNYVIETVNAAGCKAQDEVFVEVTKEYNIYIPNIFTPNFDGMNDMFLVYGTGISKIELIVFDRWGEKLFTSTDQLKGWDGTYKGQLSKNDVYVYLVNYTTIDGKKHTKSGHVSLLK